MSLGRTLDPRRFNISMRSEGRHNPRRRTRQPKKLPRLCQTTLSGSTHLDICSVSRESIMYMIGRSTRRVFVRSGRALTTRVKSWPRWFLSLGGSVWSPTILPMSAN